LPCEAPNKPRAFHWRNFRFSPIAFVYFSCLLRCINEPIANIKWLPCNTLFHLAALQQIETMRLSYEPNIRLEDEVNRRTVSHAVWAKLPTTEILSVQRILGACQISSSSRGRVSEPNGHWSELFVGAATDRDCGTLRRETFQQ
jgi:hypothetical protein